MERNGFSILKRDEVSKIHLEDDQPLQSCKNYIALYELFGMNALWSGENGKPSSYSISFLVLLKTRRTYDLKLNALLIFCNLLEGCSDLMSHDFQMLSLEILY